MSKFSTLLLFCIFYTININSQELIDSVYETFQDVAELNIKGAFCKVDVIVGADNIVELEGQIRSVRRHEEIKIKYRQKGNVLNIWVEKPDNLPMQTKGYLLLTVPASINLNIETISGNITTKDAGKSTVIIKSVSGSIFTEGVKGNLNISSVSGDIKANRVIGDVESRSLSGSIRTQEIQGNLNTSSVSGSINAISVLNGVSANSTSGSINLEEIIGQVDVKTISGGINLKSVRGDVNAETTSGAIVLESVVGGLHLKSISGRINGNDIVLTSNSQFYNTSGNIDMALATDLSMMNFNLNAASGSLVVGNTSAKRSLVYGDGEIEIVARTTSGNQRFR